MWHDASIIRPWRVSHVLLKVCVRGFGTPSFFKKKRTLEHQVGCRYVGVDLAASFLVFARNLTHDEGLSVVI